MLIDPTVLACVADVSVWFQSKENTQRKDRGMGFFSFGCATNETRAKKCSPHYFPYAIFHVVFDSRSSFFAPKPHGNAWYAGYNCAGF